MPTYDHDWFDVHVEDTDGTRAVFRMSVDAPKLNGVRQIFDPVELDDLCDQLNAVAPTPFLLDQRFNQAGIQNEPHPLQYRGVGMRSEKAVIAHSALIDADIKNSVGIGVANVGKHWVWPLELERLYGWHVRTEKAYWRGIKIYPSHIDGVSVIQPLSAAHAGPNDAVIEAMHDDYSMTAVLVHAECTIDGKRHKTRDVYNDPDLRHLAHGWPVARKIVRPTIKIGSGLVDANIEAQQKLIVAGYSLEPYGADGVFGRLTDRRVRDFQRDQMLVSDGIVGPKTWAALDDGKALLPMPIDPKPYPVKPHDDGPLTEWEKQSMFGPLEWEPGQDGSSIVITNGWAKQNIVMVDVPQLAKFVNGGKVPFHRLGAAQLQGFFSDAEKHGLLHYVKSWAGSYNPRRIRGSTTRLSSHAFGTAFDINAPQNWIGATPSDWDQHGTVLPLVGLAYDWGFWWGGWFHRRPDGMHFELNRTIQL